MALSCCPFNQGALLVASQAHGTSLHRVAVADVRASGQGLGDGEGDAGAKYAKRSSGIRRSLQRFFPSFFQPGLPVTNRYAADIYAPFGLMQAGAIVPVTVTGALWERKTDNS